MPWRPYVLYADGEVGLEMVEVFCQLVTMVIVGEQALKKCQQLEEKKKQQLSEDGEEQEGLKTVKGQAGT